MMLLPILGCVVHYGASGAGKVDEATLSAEKARYTEQASKIDALVGQAQEVDQRDRLEAAWQLARALATNPGDQAAVQTYLDTLVKIEQRGVPQNVEAAGKEGALDSFAPQGQKIEEETIAQPDPAPSTSTQPPK